MSTEMVWRNKEEKKKGRGKKATGNKGDNHTMKIGVEKKK